jgi:tRNA-2-methylthio-N6-dimethylallyladenosine synthase
MSEKERNDAKKGENKDNPGHGKLACRTGRRILLHTFGCQMNVHDSEIIMGVLEKEGYSLTDELNQAEVVILNTCAIRDRAEQKVYAMLGKLSKMKERRFDSLFNMKIVVCGCVAQNKSKEIIKRFPLVDIVLGTKDLTGLVNLLRENANRVAFVEGDDFLEPGADIIKRNFKYKAWVSIIRGCQNFCSYCIVPYVRGREISREPKDILDEIKRLADDGVREICLLGQNVNSYGKDLCIEGIQSLKNPLNPPLQGDFLLQENPLNPLCQGDSLLQGGFNFIKLLEAIDKLGCISRVKFVTSHPKDISVELLYAMRDLSSVCEFLHFPCQSGSDRILEKMNRGYNRDRYIEKVYQAREIVPNIAIGTDIIVGFPGETDEDFNDTKSLMQELKFDHAYIFKFSKRKGTKAFEMEDQVPEDIKKQRHKILLDLQEEHCLINSKKAIGRVVEVLVEDYNSMHGHRYQGRSRENKIVVFKAEGREDLVGKIVNVKVDKATAHTLQGEGV